MSRNNLARALAEMQIAVGAVGNRRRNNNRNLQAAIAASLVPRPRNNNRNLQAAIAASLVPRPRNNNRNLQAAIAASLANQPPTPSRIRRLLNYIQIPTRALAARRRRNTSNNGRNASSPRRNANNNGRNASPPRRNANNNGRNASPPRRNVNNNGRRPENRGRNSRLSRSLGFAAPGVPRRNNWRNYTSEERAAISAAVESDPGRIYSRERLARLGEMVLAQQRAQELMNNNINRRLYQARLTSSQPLARAPFAPRPRRSNGRRVRFSEFNEVRVIPARGVE
jgi:hypothetical protein